MRNKGLLLVFVSLLVGTIVQSCNRHPYVQGERLYQAWCANCHMEQGQGLKGLIPPLDGADYLRSNLDDLACIVYYGMDGAIVVNGKEYEQAMAGIQDLKPAELANLINFITHEYVIPYDDQGNYEYVSPADVEERIEACGQLEKWNQGSRYHTSPVIEEEE